MGPQLRPLGHCVSARHPPSTMLRPVAPHRLGTPAPPQVSEAVRQLPQLRRPPQPSETAPQLAFIAAQVRLTHPMAPPHCDAAPAPPQVCGAVQLPQSMTPPHPSPMGPQFALAEAQVTSEQVGAPPSGSALPPAAAEPPAEASPPATPPPVEPGFSLPASSPKRLMVVPHEAQPDCVTNRHVNANVETQLRRVFTIAATPHRLKRCGGGSTMVTVLDVDRNLKRRN
jgi:hypothetical protein